MSFDIEDGITLKKIQRACRVCSASVSKWLNTSMVKKYITLPCLHNIVATVYQ